MPEKAREEKTKTLNLAMTQIERQFGKGAIMRLGSNEAALKLEVIPIGIPSIDHALGVGGIPRGRVVEIYGAEASGKTTLALHIVAASQRLGGVSAFIDAEHALDPVYAKSIGVNTDELLISQPDTGEQALEIADMLVKSGAVDIIVIDSVAALVPRAEIEGEMGAVHVGLQARLMSQALRKLSANISRSNCVVIFINQIREKIGVMFGSPLTTTGGRALKFYASLRLEVRRIASVKQGNDIIGAQCGMKVVKNKVAPPFKNATFDIIFGKGICRVGDILDIAVENNIIKKAGAWFSYGDEKLGQGRENVRDLLKENPDMLAEIELKVREFLGLVPSEGNGEPVEEEGIEEGGEE
jgi:recombination protein RecA